jgi:hypothetical protein
VPREALSIAEAAADAALVKAGKPSLAEAKRRRLILPPLAPPRPVGPILPPPDDVLAALVAPADVDVVLEAVFAYLGVAFRRRAFLLVRPNLAQGFRTVNMPCPPRELKVSLVAPSIFTSVLLSQLPFVGEIPETPVTKELIGGLGGPPCFAVLLPVLLGAKAVGLFFGDRGDPRRGADGPTLIALRRVGLATAQALYRLMQAHKAAELPPETTPGAKEEAGG